MSPSVAVLIPAHNEADQIAIAIKSITPGHRVIVIADNCTDETATIAASHGAEVFHTVGNTDKKAGALNQALTLLLDSDAPDSSYLLMVDADTALCEGFVAAGVAFLTPEMGAVSGMYGARSVPGLLPLLQAVEYIQDQRRAIRRGGKVHVLSGTAVLTTYGVLREVRAARGTLLPGVPGDVYDSRSLTEDYELTLAIRTLGYSPRTSADLRTTTDVMTTWRDLVNQRSRWQRGTIETLKSYGWTKTTRMSWVRQVGAYSMTTLTPLSLALYAWTFERKGIHSIISVSPWLLFLPLMSLDQLVQTWRGSRKGRLLAAVIVPTWFYELFRASIYWLSLSRALRGADRAWVANGVRGEVLHVRISDQDGASYGHRDDGGFALHGSVEHRLDDRGGRHVHRGRRGSLADAALASVSDWELLDGWLVAEV